MSEDTSAIQAAQRIAALAAAARGQILHLAHTHLDFDQVVRLSLGGDVAGLGFDTRLAAARMQTAHRVSVVASTATSDEAEADDAEAEAEAATAYDEPDDAPIEEHGPAPSDDEAPPDPDEAPAQEDEVIEAAEADDDDDDDPAEHEDAIEAVGGDDDDAIEAVEDDDEAVEDDDEPVPGDDEPVPGDDEPVPGDDDTSPAQDAPVRADEAAQDTPAGRGKTLVPLDDEAAGSAEDAAAPGDEESTQLMSREDDEATVLRNQSDDEVAAALARLAAQGSAQPGDEEPSTIPAAFLGGDRKAPNLAEETTHPGDDEATMLPRHFLDPQIKETDISGQASAAVRIFGTKGQAVDTAGAKHRPIPMEEAPSRYTEGKSKEELGLVKEEAEYQGPKGPSITADRAPGQPVDTSLEANPDALPRAEVSQTRLDELTAAAEEAIQKGNLSVAADRWTDLLDLVPDHAGAYIGRGRCYLELGDYAAAMSDFQKAEDLDKDDVEPVVAMGDLYFARKEYQRAIECFDHALERQPGHAMARCRRGISHYQRKNYRQAFLDLQRAYNLDPNIPNIRKYVQMAIKKLEREGKRR